ncbi:S-fimbrial adhesin protein SfaS [Klebsiella pneumoniae]|nr:S-fimbrial adhesin protein SfaS [Klebsiella pneumoniae]
MGLLSMSVSTSQGADINITVNGRVVARPCNIATTNASIDLGDLFTFSLKSAGSTSAWHDTALSLTNCPIGTSRVVATFSGMV